MAAPLREIHDPIDPGVRRTGGGVDRRLEDLLDAVALRSNHDEVDRRRELLTCSEAVAELELRLGWDVQHECPVRFRQHTLAAGRQHHATLVAKCCTVDSERWSARRPRPRRTRRPRRECARCAPARDGGSRLARRCTRQRVSSRAGSRGGRGRYGRCAMMTRARVQAPAVLAVQAALAALSDGSHPRLVAGARLDLVADQLDVGIDHHVDQPFEGDRRLPAELLACVARIADQEVDFGRAQ